MIEDNNKCNCFDYNLVQVVKVSFKCISFESDLIQLIDKCNCFN